eukprot:g2549.t1
MASRFMALTGSSLNTANFCLEVSNYEFNAALGLFNEIGRLSFQDEPPHDHIQLENDTLLDHFQSMVHRIRTFVQDNDEFFHQLTSGLVLLFGVGVIFKICPDKPKRRKRKKHVLK